MIENAKKEGVTKFITVGTAIKENRLAIKTAREFSEVFATVGIYPHEDKTKDIDNLQKSLTKSINENPKPIVIGIGECGIDVSNWENGRTLQEQKELFDMQINLALEYNLPLTIHNRNGDKEVLELLSRYKEQNLQGVLHCFTSTWEFAKKILDLGFYISFTAIITYPSGESILETVEKIPLDRFLVETDAPYLPPQGHRNETNEPKYVKMVAEKIATLKKLPIEKVCTCAFDNTCALFDLPH